MLFPKGSLWGGKAKYAFGKAKYALGKAKYALPEGPRDSFGGSLWGGKAKYALPKGMPFERNPPQRDAFPRESFGLALDRTGKGIARIFFFEQVNFSW